MFFFVGFSVMDGEWLIWKFTLCVNLVLHSNVLVRSHEFGSICLFFYLLDCLLLLHKKERWIYFGYSSTCWQFLIFQLNLVVVVWAIKKSAQSSECLCAAKAPKREREEEIWKRLSRFMLMMKFIALAASCVFFGCPVVSALEPPRLFFSVPLFWNSFSFSALVKFCTVHSLLSFFPFHFSSSPKSFFTDPRARLCVNWTRDEKLKIAFNKPLREMRKRCARQKKGEIVHRKCIEIDCSIHEFKQ